MRTNFLKNYSFLGLLAAMAVRSMGFFFFGCIERILHLKYVAGMSYGFRSRNCNDEEKRRKSYLLSVPREVIGLDIQ